MGDHDRSTARAAPRTPPDHRPRGEEREQDRREPANPAIARTSRLGQLQGGAGRSFDALDWVDRPSGTGA